MNFTDVIYETSGKVARITINRPERHNAFRYETLEELVQAFEAADEDGDIAVIVLTGAGEKAFCSGGDVGEEGEFTKKKAWKYNRRFLQLCATMRNSAKPIIARINGWCIGGGNELNMLCDFAIASENAKLGQVGPKVGSVPITYGTQMLSRLVGERKAREIVMLCRQYTAKQACDMGWINEVVPVEQLDAAVESMCNELISKSPTALMIAKVNLNHDSDQAFPSVIQGVRLLNLGLHATDEQREGMHAFLEKRPPNFDRFRWR